MRRDAAESVADARANVDEALPAMLCRERDDPIEVLAAGVGRAVDVCGGGSAELLLDLLDAPHPEISIATHTAIVASTGSAGASRALGSVLVILSAVVATTVCAITGLAAADHYHQTSWPIEFTIVYLAVGAAWIALVLATVSGRLRVITGSFLALLAVLVAVVTIYLTRLT